MQSVSTAGKPKPKLTGAERNDEAKRRLFDAAAKVVGRLGYGEASVARITELAEVAQGTFYNHFENRQELLDQLLPTVGLQMIGFIHERKELRAADTRCRLARSGRRCAQGNARCRSPARPA
jgi:AcrR family transcriptional regulator